MHSSTISFYNPLIILLARINSNSNINNLQTWFYDNLDYYYFSQNLLLPQIPPFPVFDLQNLPQFIDDKGHDLYKGLAVYIMDPTTGAIEDSFSAATGNEHNQCLFDRASTEFEEKMNGWWISLRFSGFNIRKIVSPLFHSFLVMHPLYLKRKINRISVVTSVLSCWLFLRSLMRVHYPKCAYSPYC